jgi:hypothetical protein
MIEHLSVFLFSLAGVSTVMAFVAGVGWWMHQADSIWSIAKRVVLLLVVLYAIAGITYFFIDKEDRPKCPCPAEVEE